MRIPLRRFEHSGKSINLNASCCAALVAQLVEHGPEANDNESHLRQQSLALNF